MSYLYKYLFLYTPFLCLSLSITPVTAQHAIRLASSADLDAIMKLDIDITEEFFKPLLLQYPEYEANPQAADTFLLQEIEQDWVWFADCIALKNEQRLFVAYHEDRCIGFVVSCLYDNSIVSIDLLMLDPSYRGQGIGGTLITRCLQEFPQARLCTIILVDKNDMARRAYEKLGFHEIDEKPYFTDEKYSASYYICYAKSLCD